MDQRPDEDDRIPAGLGVQHRKAALGIGEALPTDRHLGFELGGHRCHVRPDRGGFVAFART
jgi:hypothetical protein